MMAMLRRGLCRLVLPLLGLVVLSPCTVSGDDGARDRLADRLGRDEGLVKSAHFRYNNYWLPTDPANYDKLAQAAMAVQIRWLRHRPLSTRVPSRPTAPGG